MEKIQVRYDKASRKVLQRFNGKWSVIRENVSAEEAVKMQRSVGSSGTFEITESASHGQRLEEVTKTRLVDAYRGMGLSEADAKLAAGVETAVVSGKASKLVESFKLLGMSEAAARVAAERAVKY